MKRELSLLRIVLFFRCVAGTSNPAGTVVLLSVSREGKCKAPSGSCCQVKVDDILVTKLQDRKICTRFFSLNV